MKGWICVLLMMPLFGCSQQFLTKPYPLWGREVNLTASEDGRPPHMQLLEPQRMGSAQACMLIVHGMNEYMGRYADIARYFSDRAIVAGLDLSAHGLSNADIAEADNRIRAGAGPQDIGQAYLEQAALGDLQPMFRDIGLALHYLIDYCDRQTGDGAMPVFILSHSLGSLAAASYLLHNEDRAIGDRIGGIILAGPAFSVTRVPGWRGWLQNPLVCFSYHTHEHFLNPHDEALPLLLFNQLLSLISVPIQDGIVELLSLPGMRELFSPSTPDWVVNYLSNWEEERERHNADPLIIRRSVLRYVLAVEKAVIAFRRRMADFSVPYLLIYAEHDPITPAWGNSDFVDATRQHHPHNQVMRLADENHHEQLFSTPALRQRILQTIDAWITLRISAD